MENVRLNGIPAPPLQIDTGVKPIEGVNVTAQTGREDVLAREDIKSRPDKVEFSGPIQVKLEVENNLKEKGVETVSFSAADLQDPTKVEDKLKTIVDSIQANEQSTVLIHSALSRYMMAYPHADPVAISHVTPEEAVKADNIAVSLDLEPEEGSPEQTIMKAQQLSTAITFTSSGFNSDDQKTLQVLGDMLNKALREMSQSSAEQTLASSNPKSVVQGKQIQDFE